MVGEGKSKELITKLKDLDWINELPDHLISHILTHLPTKDAVRTSVVSTRWKTLWLCVSSVRLHNQDFLDSDAFVSFGDRFFGSNRASCVDKVELYVDRNENIVDHTSYVTSWVDAAVKRKIKHLHVKCEKGGYNYYKRTNYFHEMPLSLYSCKTLVSLKLFRAVLPDSESVSLPCLKTMHITYIWNLNEATFERLVSSCPVLEELEINSCLNENVTVFRVRSKSLKKLIVQDGNTEFVIDTPRLGFLSIDAELSEGFTITNVDPNVKLVIHIHASFADLDEVNLLSNINRFRSSISGTSKIRDITIFAHASVWLHFTLEFNFHLKWLPTILESCPNLKSLSLESDCEDFQELKLEEMDQISFSTTPQCLLSSLEFVDFNVPLTGLFGEMNLVRYILEKAVMLKKLTLRLRNDSSTKDDLVMKLLNIPRSSTKCEVVFLDIGKE